ncbi:MAG: hypothetical protein HOG19_13045 [Gammaproteobacteria bacterium]|jgi:hypothetical protein|nr:hypothetical protein [Gammaproteobacteria bacterium]
MTGKTSIPKPKCFELSNVVWYEGGQIARHTGRQVRVDRVHNDGQTIDLTWTNNGVEYQHISVSHTSKMKDVTNAISPEAIRLRGLWATVQEHDKLRERDEQDRLDRVRDSELRRKELDERQAIIKKKVMVEARKDGADFSQIAENFGVMEADVRDWALAPVAS